MNARPHVVIIGGGFGGLSAARELRRAPVDVALIDRSPELPSLSTLALPGCNRFTFTGGRPEQVKGFRRKASIELLPNSP